MVKKNICVIILAGGESKRLGTPKQLIPYKNTTLLEHTIQSAVDSLCDEVIVVLGANFETIINSIKQYPVQVCENKEWKEGIASSISNGILHADTLKNPFDAYLFLVCDQPHVNSEILDSLIIEYALLNKSIIACKYGQTLGVPVLFDNKYRENLCSLKGDYGAKNLIVLYKQEVHCIPFNKGELDIDTPNDLKII